MNSVLKNVVSNIFSSVNFVQTQFIPVRYRYYADRIAKGPYSKKFGYKDKIFSGGVLPRLKDAPRLQHPIYRPKNVWSPDLVKLGQNDYIDLLGGGKLKPPYIAYDVPGWLRGRKGKEYRLLVLKRSIFDKTDYAYKRPTLWKNLLRRTAYLYRKLNSKTKTGVTTKQ